MMLAKNFLHEVHAIRIPFYNSIYTLDKEASCVVPTLSAAGGSLSRDNAEQRYLLTM